MSERHVETAPPTTTIVLGPLRLAGRSAAVFVVALLAGIVALLVYYRAGIRSTPLTISAILWIAFVVYWSRAAAGSAPAIRSESARSRALHQNAMWLSLLLLFVPVPWLDVRLLPLGAGWVATGLAVHAASFGLAIAARRALGRNWSGEITEKADHQLIRSGPYRFVRHPIYSAMLGMFVGTALVSGDAHAFLGVALMAAAYARKIPLEEGNLDEAFGAAYADYRRTTRALIPWVF
jgi:protein-S-isoprenylcysteine O-methyltransferase Ste14